MVCPWPYRSRTTPCSATPPRLRSSARTAPWTGCACPASTPTPASRPCSGTPEHGRWLLGPPRSRRRVHASLRRGQRRAGDDLDHLDRHGARPGRDADATTAAPTSFARSPGVEGTVTMRHEWVVRFGYGKIRPWVRRERHARPGGHHRGGRAGPSGAARAPAAPRRGRPPRRRVRGVHRGGADLLQHLGELLDHELPEPLAFEDRITASIDDVTAWADTCSYQGPYREAVVRSLITLRLLTHGGTGGIVAAADHLAARGRSAASATGTTGSAGCATPR